MQKPLLTQPVKYLLLITGTCLAFACFFNNHQVDFSTEVKPILNNKCISCHGGVKKQGGFGLLFREDALAITKSGKPAIIPGNADKSEMIIRLSLTDPEERMPYKHPPLSKQEIALLSKWIDQGAKWGEHWAYVPVKKPNIEKASAWAKNAIDHYVANKLKEQGWDPSPAADKATLARRLSLDLIGMPATDQVIENYLKQTVNNSNDRASNNANEKATAALIDGLMASPHFGERWASVWMDLARYADTKGYERDDARNIYRYRDWLINAFNENKPYDQFLTEQIAGDLLPNASDAQMIATAFHRNTMTNDEGGTDNEEFRTAAVIDRVNTTWETLMGTSFACVQCHSHPYDPFKQEEYYKFLAFFNNTRDEDTYDEYPLLREFHGKDSLRFLQLQNWLTKAAPERKKELIDFVKTQEPAINSIAADQLVNAALTDTKWLVLRNQGIARYAQIQFEKNTQLRYRYITWKSGGVWELHLDAANGPLLQKVYLPNTAGKWSIATVDLPAIEGKHDLYFTYRNAQLSAATETGIQFDWYAFTHPFPGKNILGYDTAYAQFNQLLESKEVTKTPIMIENSQALTRPTWVFVKGNWLVKGKSVQAGVPASLGKLPAGAPANRLGLAKWMVDKSNPLTARTFVNRIWEQFFGNGLVETLEDLGSQGMQPIHQSLLDYLSWQFMYEYQWDVKKLMKEILMSATYQQDSKWNAIAEKDPSNKYYARAPRVRLSAEQIRDQALEVSGLLSKQLYGPSVFPYQPAGIWMSPWNGANWQKSEGHHQYRRALYTYWKRSAPYPSMISFDGATREVCTARRIRTNTPLQALVSLNDSVYTEAAQHLALRMRQPKTNQDAATPASSSFQLAKNQIAYGYQLAMKKPIEANQLAVMFTLYEQAFRHYSQDLASAKLLVGIAASEQGIQQQIRQGIQQGTQQQLQKIAQQEKQKETLPKAQQGTKLLNNELVQAAALTVVAGAILNLDEFITKN